MWNDADLSCDLITRPLWNCQLLSSCFTHSIESQVSRFRGNGFAPGKTVCICLSHVVFILNRVTMATYGPWSLRSFRGRVMKGNFICTIHWSMFLNYITSTRHTQTHTYVYELCRPYTYAYMRRVLQSSSVCSIFLLNGFNYLFKALPQKYSHSQRRPLQLLYMSRPPTHEHKHTRVLPIYMGILSLLLEDENYSDPTVDSGLCGRSWSSSLSFCCWALALWQLLLSDLFFVGLLLWSNDFIELSFNADPLNL